MRRRWWAAAVAALVVAACGGDPGTDDVQTVTVFAAASLTDVFRELEPLFEDANPGVDLRFNFAGSSDLAQQIVNGAPADVFASADIAQMQVVSEAVLLTSGAQPFATNRLTIAVPAGNPAGIDSLADLADDALVLVTCAPQVPCGGAAERLATSAGVDLRPDSEEPDVRSVLAKVRAGEADAGLTWVSDVATADGVDAIEIPEAATAPSTYPIGVIGRMTAVDNQNDEPSDPAAKFVHFVLGPIGQRALADAGFGAP